MGVLECQHLKQEEVAMEPGSAENGQRIKLSLRGARHGWVGEEMGTRGKDGQRPECGQSFGAGPQTLGGEANGRPLKEAPSLRQRGEVRLGQKGTIATARQANGNTVTRLQGKLMGLDAVKAERWGSKPEAGMSRSLLK